MDATGTREFFYALTKLTINRSYILPLEWNHTKPMVVHLPNGSTRTLSISQDPVKRYWFGMCPVTSKTGELKMCAGCRTVGYAKV